MNRLSDKQQTRASHFTVTYRRGSLTHQQALETSDWTSDVRETGE